MVDNICILKNLLQVTSQVGGRLSHFMHFHWWRDTDRCWKMKIVSQICFFSCLGDISECKTSDTSRSGHLREVLRVQCSSLVLSGPEDTQHTGRPALTQPASCRRSWWLRQWWHWRGIGIRLTWGTHQKCHSLFWWLQSGDIQWRLRQKRKIHFSKAGGAACCWYSRDCFRPDAGERKQTRSHANLLSLHVTSIHLTTIFFVSQKYILFHEAQEHRVSTGLIALYATHQNQTSTVISSGSAAFYMPASLIQLLFVHHSREAESRLHRPCVLGMLTELTHSPYAWARYPGRVRMTWHGDTWRWNGKGIALIFLCWFPAEWTCGRPKSVRVQHEEKDPRSLPHSANKHRAAATTKKRTSLSLLFCCFAASWLHLLSITVALNRNRID